MPEIKVSALPAAAAPNGTEVVPAVQGGVTKKIPVGAAYGLATLGADGKLPAAQSATIQVGQEYVAAATGVAATDTATLQNALNSPLAQDIWLGQGLYVTDTPLTVPRHDISIHAIPAPSAASTARGTWIQNSVSDLFSLAGDRFGLSITGLNLQSGGGGGHILAAAAGANLAALRLLRVTLIQQNATKSLFSMLDGSIQDSSFREIKEAVASTASVPGWNIKGAGGGINTCLWEKVWHDAGALVTAPAFHVEETGTLAVADLVFRDIVMEIVNGGCIKLQSAINCLIEQVNIFDLSGATTGDLFHVGKSATGLTSKYTTFRKCVRHGGTLGAGLVDIRLATSQAPLTAVEECGTSTLSGFTVDAGSNAGVTIKGGHSSDVITNVNSDTIVESMGVRKVGNGTYTISETGEHSWGAGGGAASDLTMSRLSTGRMYTPNNFRVGAALIAQGSLTAGSTVEQGQAKLEVLGNAWFDDAAVRTITVGTVNGLKIGGGATEKLGFFGASPVVRPAANPDTSGATLAALETEVNELKALLRSLGLLT